MDPPRSTTTGFSGRLRSVFPIGGRNDVPFDAFVSYSHAADGKLTPALQGAMQRLAKP